MTVKRAATLLALLFVVSAFPAWGQGKNCHRVGGVLMTNVGSIPLGSPGPTNLGPAFGNLNGSVAAEYLGNFTFQHYWVTAAGDTIKFGPATLNAEGEDLLDGGSVVVVRWGHYKSNIIAGGTGRFAKATGWLEYSGLVDFNQNTLVLRYRGEVCYNDTDFVASGK